MFKAGDFVYINDSAQIDIGGYAWNYVTNHRDAQIVCAFSSTKSPCPEKEILYVVEWPEVFKGGWHCWDKCKPGQGQIVTAKHMDLKFEASREVVTVPNIVVPEDYGEHL